MFQNIKCSHFDEDIDILLIDHYDADFSILKVKNNTREIFARTFVRTIFDDVSRRVISLSLSLSLSLYLSLSLPPSLFTIYTNLQKKCYFDKTRKRYFELSCIIIFPNMTHIYIYILGLCIFDLFPPKILISREKMNFCIKTRKQAIFLDYFKKSPRTNQKIY